MRTTLNIDDHLLAEAKRLAAERETTLTAVIEDALRIALQAPDAARPKGRRLPTFGEPGAGFMPSVDISNNAALLELMEEGLPLHKRR